MLWAEYVLRLALCAIPLYVANSTPVIFKGKKRLDLGADFFDKKPLLGESKTIKGTFAGIFWGTISGAILYLTVPEVTAIVAKEYYLFAFLLSVGAMLGDVAGSFIKRRFNFAPGSEVLILDQLGFMAIGLLLGSVLYMPSLGEIIGLIIVTLVAHRLANWIAFKVKWKKVPW